MEKLAILGYHKVGEPPADGWDTWNYVSTKSFEQHLQYLHDNGWNVISEGQLIQALHRREILPPKAVLITFDDGYQTNLTIALPLLKKFKYPAIVFVPTAFVGSYNAFDADIFYEPKEPICTWYELRELEQNNVSIQSHGVHHVHMGELTEEEQVNELKHSKHTLEAMLQKQVDIFSFPYGDNGGDDKMKTLLSNAGYHAAVLYGGGAVNIPSTDRFNLARVPVGADTDLATELRKALE